MLVSKLLLSRHEWERLHLAYASWLSCRVAISTTPWPMERPWGRALQGING